MKSRISQAVSKFLFCLRVSRNSTTFFRLLKNTRRFSKVYRSARKLDKTQYEEVSEYQFNLPGIKQATFLRTYSGDIQMFYEQFWLKVYELRLDQKSTAPIIVDAGANIGMAALYFLSSYPASLVYAVEPDPANIILLRKNLASFTAEPNSDHAPDKHCRAVIIPCALSSYQGIASLDNTGWSYNSRVRPAGELDNTITTTTLEAIIAENHIGHIDLLKIDIEGSEEALFKADLGWLRIVENILIEIHDEEVKPQIIDILAGKGFRVSKFNRNEFGDVYLATRQENVDG